MSADLLEGLSVQDMTKLAVHVLVTLADNLGDGQGMMSLNGNGESSQFFIGVCTNEDHIQEVRQMWDAAQEAVRD